MGCGCESAPPVRSHRIRFARPSCLAHVEPARRAIRADPQRRALQTVMTQRLALVAVQQAAVRVHDAPPGHCAAPEGHNPPDLPRSALADIFGDVAIRHHPACRYGLGDVKYPAREVAYL